MTDHRLSPWYTSKDADPLRTLDAKHIVLYSHSLCPSHGAEHVVG